MRKNEDNNRLNPMQFDANKQEVDLLAALAQMPQSKFALHTYLTDQEMNHKFINLAYESKIAPRFLHSLAIYEFIQKYEVCILDLQSLFDE